MLKLCPVSQESYTKPARLLLLMLGAIASGGAMAQAAGKFDGITVIHGHHSRRVQRAHPYGQSPLVGDELAHQRVSGSPQHQFERLTKTHVVLQDVAHGRLQRSDDASESRCDAPDDPPARCFGEGWRRDGAGLRKANRLQYTRVGARGPIGESTVLC